MPICIECRYPVPQLSHGGSHKKPLTTVYSGDGGNNSKTRENGGDAASSSTNRTGIKAPDTRRSNATGPRAGGEASKRTSNDSDVRLTQCPRCKRFADKYVEHDFVVLFIDLVYRHLLFNRLAREDEEFDPRITRLGLLLLLFEVYITWSHIEALPPDQISSSPIPHLPIVLQYAFYLIQCVLSTLAQHLTIRALTKIIVPLRTTKLSTTGGSRTPSSEPSETSISGAEDVGGMGGGNTHGFTSATSGLHTNANQNASPSLRVSDPRPTAISTAIFVSSCMKLFPILMVVWKYEDTGGQVARGVEWAVAVQNLEALSILLGCSYLQAGALVAAGAAAKVFMGRLLLGLVGLGAVAGWDAAL
ncbi:sterol homeostasis protein [Agyrium rufum]|nr:sterol homeostasis protein [Agyrium rufum]